MVGCARRQLPVSLNLVARRLQVDVPEELQRLLNRLAAGGAVVSSAAAQLNTTQTHDDEVRAAAPRGDGLNSSVKRRRGGGAPQGDHEQARSQEAAGSAPGNEGSEDEVTAHSIH